MFNINIHCIVFGVSEPFNKRCILSTTKDDINLPFMSLKNTNNINSQIIEFLKDFIFVNDLVLIPQIINIHSSILNKENNTIDMLFGFIIDYRSSINETKVFWIDFDPMVEHKLSPIFFETMQKLI